MANLVLDRLSAYFGLAGGIDQSLSSYQSLQASARRVTSVHGYCSPAASNSYPHHPVRRKGTSSSKPKGPEESRNAKKAKTQPQRRHGDASSDSSEDSDEDSDEALPPGQRHGSFLFLGENFKNIVALVD